MRTAYRWLAYSIAILVAVQAAAMVFFISGLMVWVDNGGVLDKTVIESDNAPFSEESGLSLHWVNGTMVIPLVAIALVVVGFLTRDRRAIRWAWLTFLLVGLQIFLGLAGWGASIAGLLHGVNAIALVTVALYTGARVTPQAPPGSPEQRSTEAPLAADA
ncbi:hypothetical protein [Demequina soli]|uniref:hypothetical protein n=1 Tax=Demequina soli TaxID=1638987 RepID=UPI000783E2F4|nr:hypothetical protein [Demequina soli]